MWHGCMILVSGVSIVSSVALVLTLGANVNSFVSFLTHFVNLLYYAYDAILYEFLMLFHIDRSLLE